MPFAAEAKPLTAELKQMTQSRTPPDYQLVEVQGAITTQSTKCRLSLRATGWMRESGGARQVRTYRVWGLPPGEAARIAWSRNHGPWVIHDWNKGDVVLRGGYLTPEDALATLQAEYDAPPAPKAFGSVPQSIGFRGQNPTRGSRCLSLVGVTPGAGVMTPLLTPKQVAEQLQVSPSWIFSHARGKRKPYLKSIKLGRSVRFKPEDVAAFIADFEKWAERLRA